MSVTRAIGVSAEAADQQWLPRAAALFAEQRDRLDRWMDRSMAALFLIQWVFEITLATWVSPLAWAGLQSKIHPHVWMAVVLGGLVVSLPLALIYFRPGEHVTRLSIAIAQGLTVAILIHLTGGRIETHFYVFVSLALLAFYRDWTVLLAMSAVVALDHFVRGVYWPQSIYGVAVASPLRFIEHTCWVLMEDLYLWMLCRQSLLEIWETAERQAQLEEANTEMAVVNTQLRDEVVERRRVQQELEQAKNAAEAANRAKSEFLANMSHELRTPLNSVIGFSDVLVEQAFGPLNENQAQYVTDILDSGQHLLSLVNDILDLAKIEAGSLEINFGPVDVGRLVERSLQMFRERAIRSGVRLAAQTDPRADHFEADERRLKQLLYNLLSNAIKFTNEGGEVRVEVELRAEGLELKVVDTGVGVPAHLQEKIFESFYQADSTLSKNAQGTGLGLAVARQIAELHGGTIHVHSELGEGSTFIVRLPSGNIVDEVEESADRLEPAAAAST
ncbi:MAG: ATP-binding protein [Pirellulales bacterium]